jgi:hypothetical protein
MNSRKKSPMILNGTKVWLSAILFLIAQTGSGIWWASSINTSVKSIDKKVDTMITVVEQNRKEAKEDLKDLRREVLDHKSL